uniref:Putative capsid protein n=1 Tax=Red panda circovirus 7 TaxID=2863956 RepID=A0A8K1HJN1_9CIRC|nr:putative capsid protein [Red panda circovirus 7]
MRRGRYRLGRPRRRRTIRRPARRAGLSRRRYSRRPRVGRLNSAVVTQTFRCFNVNAVSCATAATVVDYGSLSVYDWELQSYLLLNGSPGNGDCRSLGFYISPSVNQLIRASTGDAGYAAFSGFFNTFRVRKYTLILRPPQGLRSIFTQQASATTYNYPELAGLPSREPAVTYIDPDQSFTLSNPVPTDGDYTTSCTNAYGYQRHRFGSAIVVSLRPRTLSLILQAKTNASTVANFNIPVQRFGHPWQINATSQPWFGGIFVWFPYLGSSLATPYNQPQIRYGIESRFKLDFKSPLYA